MPTKGKSSRSIFDRLMDGFQNTLDDAVDDLVYAAEREMEKMIQQQANGQRVAGQPRSKARTKAHKNAGKRGRTSPRANPPHSSPTLYEGTMTYYDVLEVSRNASHETIEAAYKSLCKRYHPDVNSGLSSTERMKWINAAWGVLKDNGSRAEYDRVLRGMGR